MDSALLFAVAAGAAVMLLFFGVFGGRRVSPTERIEQVASGASEARTDSRTAPAKNSLRSKIFGSRTATGLDNVVEKRDWGANQARELARADLQLRPSEYLALRAAAIIGAPMATYMLGKTIIPGLDNDIALLVAALVGW